MRGAASADTRLEDYIPGSASKRRVSSRPRPCLHLEAEVLLSCREDGTQQFRPQSNRGGKDDNIRLHQLRLCA